MRNIKLKKKRSKKAIVILKKKKLLYFKNFKNLLIKLKKKQNDTLLINKIKQVIKKKKLKRIKNYYRQKSFFLFKYNIYNSIINVYYNIKHINEFSKIINIFNKKKIDIFTKKSTFQHYLNLYFMRKQYLPFYIINSNISVIGNYKRYGLIKKLNNVFIGRSLRAIIGTYWTIEPIITKFKFFEREQKWFRRINRKEPIAFNLNNIVAIVYELKLFLDNLSNYYFSFYNKLIFVWRLFIKSIKKFIILVNKKRHMIIKSYIKKYKIIFKNIKFYIYNINKFKKLYAFYWFNFKKFNIIYKKYLQICTISNFKYHAFSFILPLSRLKKKVNKKQYNLYYAKKKRNMIYMINNIIYKFFYFIFLYWFNIYIIYNLQINKLSLFLNTLYLNNNNFIISINFYNYFYQRRYRRRFKYKKIQFLDHFKNNQFLLYYKNTINLNESK